MLDNIRIATKMYLVIAIMALTAIAIAITGATGLGRLNTVVHRLDVLGTNIHQISAMESAITFMNRGEYRIMAFPADLEETRKNLKTRIETFTAQWDAASKSMEPAYLPAMNEIRDGFQSYQAEMEASFTMVDGQARAANTDSARAALNDKIAKSRAANTALYNKVRLLADRLDKDGTALAADAATLGRELQNLILGVAVGGILLGVIAGTLVAKYGLVTPIGHIVACLATLSKGKLDTDVYGTKRRDEVGDIARTALIFRDNMRETERLRAEQDREQAARAAQAARLQSLTQKFDADAGHAISVVAAAATQMQATSSTLSTSAEQTTRQTVVVAAAAQEATSNVQTVAAAAEELSASIREISQRVSQSTQVAGAAVRQAGETGAIIASLEETTGKIGEIVGLITSIASQTNLLALNATIEAARAGEAGKGFAVVANEVKSLANQTAKATDEISAQIGSVQNATKQAVSAIAGISQTIEEMSGIATTIAAAVEEQGAATNEIARNIEQAAAGASSVTENIHGVAKAAEETGHSSHDVLQAATSMAREAEQLRGLVETFLADTRAA